MTATVGAGRRRIVDLTLISLPILLAVLVPYAAPRMSGLTDIHPATIVALLAVIYETAVRPREVARELRDHRLVYCVAALVVAGLALTNWLTREELDFAFLVNLFVAPVLMFLVIASVGRRNPDALRLSTLVFIGLVAAQAPLAVAQIVTGHPVLWGDALARFDWLTTMLGEQRALGTFDHPLVLGLAAVVALAATTTIRRLGWRLVATALLMTVVIATQGRVALVVAVLTLAVMVFVDVRLARARLFIVVGGVLSVLALLLSPFGHALVARFVNDRGSNDRRFESLVYFAESLPSHLLVGEGTGVSLDETTSMGLRASLENPLLMLVFDGGLVLALAWFVMQWALALGAGRSAGQRHNWRALILVLLPALTASAIVQTFSSIAVPSAASMIVWMALAWASVRPIQLPPDVKRERTALIWRTDLLPGSETFIRNQVAATDRWNPILMGARKVPSALNAVDDIVLYGSSRSERVFRKLFLLTGWSARADKVIRSRGVAVIHAHFGTGGVTIFRTAKRNRIPLVVTVHGYDVTSIELRTGWRGVRYRWRMSRMLRYASMVIAVSEFISEQTTQVFGVDPTRIRVLPVGIPLRTGETVEATRDLLFVGRLVEKKGVADILAALRLLRTTGITPSLTVVGEGRLRRALEARSIADGLDVSFVGALPPDEVDAHMRSSRLFVAPSRTAPNGDSEGFGMVFLEAAHAGLPVIAYRHGGVPEAVADGETGILVAEGDIEVLAEAIQSLLLDHDRRAAMAQAAVRRVGAEFNIDVRTEALQSLYDEVRAGWRY